MIAIIEKYCSFKNDCYYRKNSVVYDCNGMLKILKIMNEMKHLQINQIPALNYS